MMKQIKKSLYRALLGVGGALWCFAGLGGRISALIGAALVAFWGMSSQVPYLAAALAGEGDPDAEVVPEGEAAGPRSAAELAQEISERLYGPQLFDVIVKEGLAYGASLDAYMLGGQGGEYWLDVVGAAYQPDKMLAEFDRELRRWCEGERQACEAAVTFMASDLGRKLALGELTARENLLDPNTLEAAEVAVDRAREAGDGRLRQLRRVIEAGNYLDQNVAAGLRGLLAFERGQALTLPEAARPSDQALQDTVAREEPHIRQEAEIWLYAFMYQAYAEMSEADLRALAEFWQSPDGAAFLSALFTADLAALSSALSDVGQGVGRFLQGREI